MTDAGQPIELTTHVAARPATVLRFFTDPERFAAWFGPSGPSHTGTEPRSVLGAGSTIDPVPGGKFMVVYPDGQAAAGEVVELDARRIVLTWGVDGTLTCRRAPAPSRSP